jgi:hypothetical protein
MPVLALICTIKNKDLQARFGIGWAFKGYTVFQDFSVDTRIPRRTQELGKRLRRGDLG